MHDVVFKNIVLLGDEGREAETFIIYFALFFHDRALAACTVTVMTLSILFRLYRTGYTFCVHYEMKEKHQRLSPPSYYRFYQQ